MVGWIDFDAPDAPDVVARLSSHCRLVGLRPMVQDLADDDWLARPALAPVFEAMVAVGLVFDALVLPRHLPQLLRVVERHPDLAVVVDHGAKPRIAARDLGRWREDLRAVAYAPEVACKLSGLLTEAAPGDGLPALRPAVDAILDAFGPRRVLWGSDWPVVNLAGGYDRWREISLAALAALEAPARDAVLGGNAKRVYLRHR